LTVQLVSKISNLCDPDPPTSQTNTDTDRQTDRHAIESNIIQIVTGIEVNGELYFLRLQEYCPSVEGTWAIWAIFLQPKEIKLTIDQ